MATKPKTDLPPAFMVVGTSLSAQRANALRAAVLRNRGMQPLCGKCGNPCKVFSAPNSSLVCGDFDAKSKKKKVAAIIGEEGL